MSAGEMYNMGYDSEYDIRSKASLAWVIDGVIHTGERGQLDVVLYMWQSRGNEPCKFSLEVRRGSSGQVLLPATTAKKAACTRADEKTLDWWLVAADVFLTPVDGTGRTAAHFETKRVEAADGIRGDESD